MGPGRGSLNTLDGTAWGSIADGMQLGSVGSWLELGKWKERRIFDGFTYSRRICEYRSRSTATPLARLEVLEKGMRRR